MLSLIRKLPLLAQKVPLQTRSFYGYVGRPREQLSVVETWVHGTAIACGILGIPVWVLVHIKEYRGIDEKPE